jgi:hypothetical protein
VISRAEIDRLRGRISRGLSGQSGAARHFLDAVRGLFRWAVKARLVKIDPTAGVENRVCRVARVFRSLTAATNSSPARTARSASSSRADRSLWLQLSGEHARWRGYATPLGKPYSASAVQSMLGR